MAYLLAREKKLPRRADERAWKWQEEKAGEEERHSLYKLGSFRIELPKLWLVLHYFPSLIHLSSSYGKVSFRIDMSNDAAAHLLLSLCSSSFVLCEREDLSSVISSPSLIPPRPRIPAVPVSPADFWTLFTVASIPGAESKLKPWLWLNAPHARHCGWPVLPLCPR